MMVFYRNPRLLVTAVGLVVVAGLSALATIVRQEDPTITNGAAVIVAPFPGASAERVEALVTEKIEAEFRELSEIETVSSTSRNGVAVVAVELDEQIQGRQAEEAFSKVRDALSDAYAQFPPGLPPPLFDDERFGAYSLITGITWSMPGAPQRGILKRYAEELQDVLRDVPGTDAVRVFGAPREEISVTFDPQAIAAAGLTTGQVAQAIAGADAKVSAGVLRGVRNNVLIEVTGELDSLERIRRIPLTRAADGASLLLGDIADVRRSVEQPASDLAIVNGEPAVVVAAKLAVGERFERWSGRALAKVEEFEAQLPDGLGLQIVFDQAEYTEARLSGLVGNLFAGFVIVVTVLFVTLGARSALIASLTLPLVSLASIFVLRLLGVPIHQMSVTGLIVALGLLVDNAIVVVDSIRAKRLEGADRSVAVQRSLSHLWSPLLSSTLTTILAFMPILLLKGRVGEFVGAIGLSVIVALAISYAFSMTIVPAFAGRFLQGKESGPAGFWRRGLTLPRLTAWFVRSLDWSLARPRRSMLLASTLPVLGVVGALTLPQQFFPPADRDQLHLEMRLPQQASIEETVQATAVVDDVLGRNEDIVAVNWFIGRSAPAFYYNLRQDQDGTPSYAQAQIRASSAEAVERMLGTLQSELDAAVPSAQILVRELTQGPPVDAPIEIRLYGPNLDTLRALGLELRARLSNVPSIVHSLTTLTAMSPKIWLRADEDKSNLAGLDLVDIANQLNFRLEGIAAGSILEDNEEIPVRVRVSNETRSMIDRIGSTSLLSPSAMIRPTDSDGGFPGIPLESLVDVELRPSLDGIPHRNGRRVNVVRGYTAAGVFPDTAFSALQEVLDANPVVMPPGYRMEVGGDAAERKDAMGNLFAYVPVLVLLMIAMVSLSLNSFRLGAVVFAVAIQSMGLGLLSVAIFRFPLGFQALIGLVGLVGVAINAAIVINAALKIDPDAVAGSALAVRRIVVADTSRHIISTTITTFGGFLPLMLSSGGFWPPFATGVAGGVVLSTIISFYFVPAAFLLITRRRPVNVFEQAPVDAAPEPAPLTMEPAQ